MSSYIAYKKFILKKNLKYKGYPFMHAPRCQAAIFRHWQFLFGPLLANLTIEKVHEDSFLFYFEKPLGNIRLNKYHHLFFDSNFLTLVTSLGLPLFVTIMTSIKSGIGMKAKTRTYQPALPRCGLWLHTFLCFAFYSSVIVHKSFYKMPKMLKNTSVN